MFLRIFFNTVAGLRPATLLEKSLWHRCFPVNFAKFLRTPFLQNASGRLLLEDELITKHRGIKGVGSSSTIKASNPIDWIVFWNQFEAEMDKSNQPYMFSYLKETLEPKVRLLVHGLPFNTEDCTS